MGGRIALGFRLPLTFRLSFSPKRGNREGNRTLREVFPLYSVLM